MWHSPFSHPLLPRSLPPSVGVWYTKCFMIARAVRRHNRRRRQQPSAKCPCFPKWFFWQCFGRVTVESALSSLIATFNNNAAWQHDGGISITTPVLFIHGVICRAKMSRRLTTFGLPRQLKCLWVHFRDQAVHINMYKNIHI